MLGSSSIHHFGIVKKEKKKKNLMRQQLARTNVTTSLSRLALPFRERNQSTLCSAAGTEYENMPHFTTIAVVLLPSGSYPDQDSCQALPAAIQLLPPQKDPCPKKTDPTKDWSKHPPKSVHQKPLGRDNG